MIRDSIDPIGEGHRVFLEADRIFYIGPKIVVSKIIRKANDLVDDGATVHIHYHSKSQPECTEECEIIRPEDE